MTIKIFATGGTFDKTYDEINGRLSFITDTHVPGMLELGRSLLDVSIETLMMVDSLEMSPEQRSYIAQCCQAASEQQILITHGTDTMPETAQTLAQQVSNKTIVLTGAMVPYRFGSSDGMFNLGSALAFAQVLPAGVYIAMNGQYFPWHNVRKNTEKGLFEAIE
jgi:L-asparaginase